MCLYMYKYKKMTETSLFNKKLEEILNEIQFKKKILKLYLNYFEH